MSQGLREELALYGKRWKVLITEIRDALMSIQWVLFVDRKN